MTLSNESSPTNHPSHKASSGALPDAPKEVVQVLQNLLRYARLDGGSIAITIPHGVPLRQVIDRLDQVATGQGLSTVMLSSDRDQLFSLQRRPGVAATPGERYEIDPQAGKALRSFTEQRSDIEAQGGCAAPLTAIALAGIAVRIASLGKENLFEGRFVRGAASGLALWAMNGAICIAQASSNPDPSTTMAAARAAVLVG